MYKHTHILVTFHYLDTVNLICEKNYRMEGMLKQYLKLQEVH